MNVSVGLVSKEKFCQFCQESVSSPNGIFASVNFTQCISILVLFFGRDGLICFFFFYSAFYFIKSIITRLDLLEG